MRTLRLLILFGFMSGAHAAEALAPAPLHPSMYSFADVYRLTVAGVPLGSFAFADTEAQVRVAVQTAAPSEPRFSVSTAHDSQRWLLALAGIALAAWVAHRRLTSPF